MCNQSVPVFAFTCIFAYGMDEKYALEVLTSNVLLAMVFKIIILN